MQHPTPKQHAQRDLKREAHGVTFVLALDVRMLWSLVLQLVCESSDSRPRCAAPLDRVLGLADLYEKDDVADLPNCARVCAGGCAMVLGGWVGGRATE